MSISSRKETTIKNNATKMNSGMKPDSLKIEDKERSVSSIFCINGSPINETLRMDSTHVSSIIIPVSISADRNVIMSMSGLVGILFIQVSQALLP